MGTQGGAPPQARAAALVASFYGAAAATRGEEGTRQGDEEVPCTPTGMVSVAVYWGGGRSAASPGQTGLGAQQQQARAHVRAAGAGVREVSWARNGHGVETLCASPDPPPTLAAAGCRGLWE